TSAPSARPSATLVGIVGSILASSSLFLRLLVGTTLSIPCSPPNHCYQIGPDAVLFSAWDLLRIASAPSPTHVDVFPHPAIILAPTFIAVLLLGVTTLEALAPTWRWLFRLRFALAIVGLLLLVFVDVIAYANWASQPPYVVLHQSVVSLILAVEAMVGGYLLMVTSTLLGKHSRLRS
ncbi:MAG: hypothetical protein ACXVDA_22585, partial [Ktedonobacterales bacterium]